MEKILTVDDEPRFIRLIEANLQTAGYEVLTAPDGRTAIDIVANQTPDLVLLDIMMPEMDGFQTLDRIREFSNVPVIILTARGEEVHRVEGLNRGADDYVVKPFSANELLARVRAVIRRAQTSPGDVQERVFTHGNLQIDFAKAEVTLDGDQVFLSATDAWSVKIYKPSVVPAKRESPLSVETMHKTETLEGKAPISFQVSFSKTKTPLSATQKT